MHSQMRGAGTGNMRKVDVKVVIDDAHLGAQDAVRAAVAAAGLQVEQCIPEIGTIFGSAEEAVVERLRDVDGVLQAQSEATYALPPLDPETPQ